MILPMPVGPRAGLVATPCYRRQGTPWVSWTRPVSLLDRSRLAERGWGIGYRFKLIGADGLAIDLADVSTTREHRRYFLHQLDRIAGLEAGIQRPFRREYPNIGE